MQIGVDYFVYSYKIVSMYIPRLLEEVAFQKKLGRQMRFIAGPRQCGKTTIAKQKLKKENTEHLYYNWDRLEIRNRYRKEIDFIKVDLLKYNIKETAWVCLDEIHKYPKWKNILKDFFDTHEDQVQFIITGSARLELFRRSGDSLAGRYFLFRLFPLILAEVNNKKVSEIIFTENSIEFIEKRISSQAERQDGIEHLLKYGGFPEPYLKADSLFSAKWKESYQEKILKEDLRDISSIRQIEKVMELLYLLPERIGSPLSINALSKDLQLNFRTVQNYLHYLELTCLIFQLKPYHKKKINLVKKEKKLYLFDWTLNEDMAKRFENYVALDLLTRIQLTNDMGLDQFDLHFVRSKTGRETDFLITRNQTPWLLIEVKSKKTPIDSHHLYHSRLLGNIPFVQIVFDPGVLKIDKNIFQVSASRFLS